MNRKAIYSVFLICAAVISACNEEPAPTGTETKTIGVTVEEVKSRAVITSGANEILSLGIYGYSTGTSGFDHTDQTMLPNLFANRKAVRTSAASPWSYTPVAIWPSGPNEKSTFLAYSPHTDDIASGVVSASDADTPGCAYVTYTVEEEANVSDQVDLLYSECVKIGENGVVTSRNANTCDIGYATNNGKVLYDMKHAMAWVRFLIAPMKESGKAGEIYAVTEFYLTGGSIVNKARLNLCTGQWSAVTSGPVKYIFDHLAGLPNGCQLIRVSDGAQYLGTTDNCLMVIPQDIVQKTNKTTVTVSFWYDDDSIAPYDYNEYYITVPFPDVKFKAGSVMTYIVKLSTSGASIEFYSENTIREWVEDPDPRPIDVF